MAHGPARTLALVALVVASLSGCTSDSPSADSSPPGSPAASPSASAVEPDLAMTCTGRGSPTVVLEAGLTTGGDTFAALAAQISQTTRTCTYDRAGIGSSAPLPSSAPDPSAGSAAAALRQALADAGVAPPFVLVGWSYGGLVTQAFAARYPDRVGGLLLEDSAAPAELSAPFFADLDWSEGGRAVDKVATTRQLASADFGHIPLVVLTQGAARGRFRTLWFGYHRQQARLSTNALHVEAVGSGHEIHAEAERLELALVGELVVAARTGARLAACDDRFRQLRGRCL